MLNAKPAGISRPIPSLRLLMAALLTAGLVALLLWPPGPAQAQDGEPPPVENLRCIAETDRVAFLWDAPEWSGGETYAYDYQLSLPDGQSAAGRLIGITLVHRPGSYPTGKTASVSVEAVYETADDRQVSSAAAKLICNVGGARPLVITPGNTTRVYGGTDAMSYTVSGLVDGDAAGDVVSGSLGRAPGDDVGSYAINLGTLAVAPTYAQKYALPASPPAATYSITPKPAAYTSTGANKPYDGTTAPPVSLGGSFAAGAILSGDTVTVSGGSYASADAGTGIAVTGSRVGGADGDNYGVTLSVSGNITPREITAISGVTVNTLLADGTTNATFDTGSAQGAGVLPAELADFQAGGLVVSGAFPSAEPGTWDVSVTYSLQDHGVFKAGNYSVSAGGAADTLSGEIRFGGCQPTAGDDYDADDDGLIEVCNLTQLDAIRFDLDGNGSASGSTIADAGDKYQAAFPGIAVNGAGCPASGCQGYELTASLHFDTNGNGRADEGDAYWNGGKGWLSIGPYAAVFEGNGHTISNLHYRADKGYRSERSLRRGLFQALAETGVIRNMILKNVNLSGNGWSIGGLVGENRGTISSAALTGTVSGQRYVGGLVGENWGTISNAGVTGTVSGHFVVGGLVAWNMTGGTITDSYSSGEVSGGDGEKVGGLAGRNWGGRIVRSWSTANVTTASRGDPYIGHYVGGLVGWNQNMLDTEGHVIPGSIVGSYATGRVTGKTRVGGLVGHNDGDIFASYATGDVSGGGWSAGGLAGFNQGPISASFALGAVSARDRAGGLVGEHTSKWIAVQRRNKAFAGGNGHQCIGCSIPDARPGYGDRSGITATYWNIQAPGQTAPSGVLTYLYDGSTYTPRCTGRTAAELRQPTDYTGIYALWDDLRDFSGDSYAWDFGTSLDFPVLRDTGPSVAAQRALLPDAPDQEDMEPSERRAELIAKIKEWRNDPRYVEDKTHTDRWDRALLAFGETVADTTLTPMTADEAESYAHRGWERWCGIAESLRELEAAAQQQQQATPNQPPTVSAAIADVTIVNESGTKQVSLSGVFSDADIDTLTVTAASSDEDVATVSVASDYSSLTVSAHSRGNASITVTADDGNGGTTSDTFTVSVKAAPVVESALADVSRLEAGSTQDVSLSGVFRDADGDSLTITAISSDDAKATVTVAADQSQLTLTGVAEGTATITVTAQDADGNTVSDTFDAPVAKRYASLIAQMYEWRNDPRYVNDKAHTDRWDRTLLTFGETVADTSLTQMMADEAQGYADRGWERWVPVAAALRELESGG